ncbi:MAG: tetratricopeptide repeat protein [Bacteroidia bacterium]
MEIFSSLESELKGLDEILDNFSDDSEQLLKGFSLLAAIIATGDVHLTNKYCKRFVDEADKIQNNSKSGKAVLLLANGLWSYFSTKFSDSAKYTEEALELLESTNLIDLRGCAHFFKGAACRSIGETDLAVKHLLLGAEQINNTGYLAMYNSYSHYQLGEIYAYIKDFDSAESHYIKALNTASNLRNGAGMFRSYNGLANLYLSKKDLEKAESYLLDSLEVDLITEPQKARSFCDLGVLYFLKDNYDLSKEYLDKSIQIRKEFDLYDALSTSLIALAELEIKFNNIDSAWISINHALELTVKNNSRTKQIKCYQLLSQVLEIRGNYKEALDALKKYERMLSEQYIIQNQNIYQINKKKIEDQKNLIEGYLKDIKDSISYAKRIQQSILPSDVIVNKLLKDNFIIYLPKDVVAGDFYWVEECNNYIYVAVADCTGHGVPGAMVSVVCNYALNKCLYDYNISNTDEILDKTRELVIEQFSKSGEDVKDGMDISLCRIDYKNSKLQWSGANNPLWMIRANQLIEIKPDKMPIGKYIKNDKFTSHELNILKNDIIYLFSDGIADQFGGESNKKYLYKRLKELLLQDEYISMDENKKRIIHDFERWKGDNQQVDDVCIIGVRF